MGIVSSRIKLINDLKIKCGLVNSIRGPVIDRGIVFQMGQILWDKYCMYAELSSLSCI